MVRRLHHYQNREKDIISGRETGLTHTTTSQHMGVCNRRVPAHAGTRRDLRLVGDTSFRALPCWAGEVIGRLEKSTIPTKGESKLLNLLGFRLRGS